jgi:hypothetical protein
VRRVPPIAEGKELFLFFGFREEAYEEYRYGGKRED